MRDSIENISQLQKKLNDLQLENQILKNILDKAGLSYHKELSEFRQNDYKEVYDPEQGKRIIHPNAITENMANKFFGMFWGRQDVYAKRSVNKETGKVAYYPQCNNFWTSVCHKKMKDGVNCKDCKSRSYKTITKKDILNHLQGNSYNASDVIGVYPLLSNGTCRFMALDFDNHDKGAEEKDFANVDDTWIEEVEAMREICVLNGIDPLVERSRSGKGAHIWIFFDKPIAASLVRKFGFALLDKGAEQVNLKSFKYYDRMLPAQDSLSDNSSLGNLIALPLQGKALQDGNSAFIDGKWKENVIIYDYVDNHIPMFDNMYMKRLKAYKQIGYELSSGLKADKQMVNAIYEGDNYRETFHKDLLDANKNIIISSPAISGQKVYELISMLKEKQEAGVQITIVTWTYDSYGFGDAAYWMQLHEDMRKAGFYIKTVEEYCDRFAVIDQEVVWYGNINLMAKDKVDDSIMRVMSKEIAGELMEITFGDNDGKGAEYNEN